jgi:hypothetical protein
MQILPPNDLKIYPRRPGRRFKIFYMWGIEICNTKYNWNVWLANLLKINYLALGFKWSIKFKYKKFFYGANHRHLSIGPIYLNWGFYSRIYTKFKYITKDGKTKNNTRSKKRI